MYTLFNKKLIDEKVERLPNPKDGRVRALQLTSAGQADLQASREVRYTLYTQLLEGWTEEDRLAFGRFLARFNLAIRERHGPLPYSPE